MFSWFSRSSTATAAAATSTATSRPSMKIYVKTPSDRTFTFMVSGDTLVGDFITTIRKRGGYDDECHVQLIFAGNSMVATNTLYQYPVSNECTIHCRVFYSGGWSPRVHPLPYGDDDDTKQKQCDASLAMAASRRVAKEMNDGPWRWPRDAYMLQPVWPIDDAIHPSYYQATIIGPPSTPYENGIYYLWFRFPDRYPFVPPLVHFATPILHPNICPITGEIYGINLLVVHEWSPATTWFVITSQVRRLLQSPLLTVDCMAPSWGGSPIRSLPPHTCRSRLLAAMIVTQPCFACDLNPPLPKNSTASPIVWPQHVPQIYSWHHDAAAAATIPITATSSSSGTSSSRVVVVVMKQKKNTGDSVMHVNHDYVRRHTITNARRSPNHVRFTHPTNTSVTMTEDTPSLSLSTTTATAAVTAVGSSLSSSSLSCDDDPTSDDTEYWFKLSERTNLVSSMSMRNYFLALPVGHRHIIRTVLAISCHHSGGSGVALYPMAHLHRLPSSLILTILEWALPPLNRSPADHCVDYAASKQSLQQQQRLAQSK